MIRFRKAEAEKRRNSVRDYCDNDLICCNDNGEILSPQTLYHAFKHIIKELDLPSIRFHDLRHSYATAMLDSDVPLKVISQNLGHSSISITGDIYADSITKRKESANIIDNIFFSK
ncbi:MAG: tyrosine-type recombinase/integrase [Oscillospiraceae bacterium]